MQKDRILAAIGQESIHNKKAEIKNIILCDLELDQVFHFRLPRSLQPFVTIVDFRYCKETVFYLNLVYTEGLFQTS